jgi:hypothetical protein
VLTVRRYGSVGMEYVYEAKEVRYYPIFYWGPENIEFKFGLANIEEFIPNAPAVVVDDGKEKWVYQWGRIYVMNDNGKTIASYLLKNGGTHPKTDGPELFPGQRELTDKQAWELEHGRTWGDIHKKKNG